MTAPSVPFADAAGGLGPVGSLHTDVVRTMRGRGGSYWIRGINGTARCMSTARHCAWCNGDEHAPRLEPDAVGDLPWEFDENGRFAEGVTFPMVP